MRIAVTGGNGDMGRSLTPYLIAQGHTIVSIDRALPATPMRGVEFLIADTRDFGQFIASIRGCDALIHLAAIRDRAELVRLGAPWRRAMVRTHAPHLQLAATGAVCTRGWGDGRRAGGLLRRFQRLHQPYPGLAGREFELVP